MKAALLAAAAIAAGVVSACAHYQPVPLPDSPDLATGPAAPAPAGLAPLTVAEVVAETLRRDPDLIAVRAQRGVSQAQLLQAHLLPDPTLTGSMLPLLAGPGTTFAWNATLSEDVRALLTLSVRREGAQAAAAQVDAQLLWQEWQAAGQSRLLAVQLIMGERALRLQRDALALFADRSARLQRALAQGNVTLTVAAPDLAALQTARAQVDALERQQLTRRHQLNALLGRQPDLPLSLVDDPGLVTPAAVLRAQSTTLAQRRPDLIALRLGYRAQEARTRQAVLMQFPALTVGPGGGSDNSNVRSAGPQFNVTLPVFDRNRGDISLQRATRAQLRAEYQARLDTAYAQLSGGLSELREAQNQLDEVRRDLPAAEAAARAATAAFRAGALEELGYVDLLSARLTKAQEIIGLEQTVLEQEIALATLTGTGLPYIATIPEV